ncbi:hypothetical protein DFH08DRAFT_892449 [Mycena albidolilacea]|uniref:Uncharacterized protein n=1 Tax=Mycena albidolilacea TaxID=1033008 RepID=A0AAD7EF27_9AGAR|nr:hypothetical protein DFH08DRAFT_892449 [Mycena albidolilacea]
MRARRRRPLFTPSHYLRCVLNLSPWTSPRPGDTGDASPPTRDATGNDNGYAWSLRPKKGTGRRKDDMKEVVERRRRDPCAEVEREDCQGGYTVVPGVVRNEDSGGRFGPSRPSFPPLPLPLPLPPSMRACLFLSAQATGAMRGAATRQKCAIWCPLLDADVPVSLLPVLLSLLLLRCDTADTVSGERAGGASTLMFHPPLPHPALHMRVRRCQWRGRFVRRQASYEVRVGLAHDTPGLEAKKPKLPTEGDGASNSGWRVRWE